MSRAARTSRGALGALTATLLAAASHSIGGGTVTSLAVLTTAILSLPLCVALAGRLGSLWRLALAVCASQFLYHWAFAMLGVPTGAGTAPAATPHAGHLFAQLPLLSPSAVQELTAAGAADAAMWIAHAATAALTVALLHRGERAAQRLAGLIRRALPTDAPRAVAPLRRRAVHRPLGVSASLHERLSVLSAISHRGPPGALASDL